MVSGLEIVIIASSAALIYLLISIKKDLSSPEADAVKLPSEKERKVITLQELSKIWRLQCFEEEEAKRLEQLKELDRKLKELKKQKEEQEKKIKQLEQQQATKEQEEIKQSEPLEQEEPQPTETKGEKQEELQSQSEQEEPEEPEDKDVIEALKQLTEGDAHDEPDKLFNNPKVQEFYEKHVWPLDILKDNERKVILRLLKILDEKGNVPSVVQIKGGNDPDLTRDATEYAILKKVPLVDHSLHVAEIMIEEDDSLLTRAKRIIAALAHDIGKIQDFYEGKKYVFGSHAQTSAAVLESIEGFKELEYAKEVEEAVIKHHLSPPEGLGTDLKQADRKARQEEVFEITKKPIEEILKEKDKEIQPQPQARSDQLNQKQLKQNNVIDEDKDDEEGGIVDMDRFNQGTQQDFDKIRTESKDVNLEWLPIDEMIRKIGMSINFETPRGGFDAFSDTRGYVFVQVGKVMDIFRELAIKYKMADMYNLADQQERQKILLALADLFRANGYLAEGLVKPGFFGGKFDLIGYDGSVLRTGMYMPFWATAFVDDISKLERRKVKGGTISKIKEVRIARN